MPKIRGEWKEPSRKKEKKKLCWYKFNWENAIVNSIGKRPFTGAKKNLVNIPVHFVLPSNCTITIILN